MNFSLKKLPLILLIFLFCACDKEQQQVRSIEDIDGKKIGVLLGSIYDDYCSTHFPNSEILRYNMNSDIPPALRSQQIDVGICDDVTAQQMALKKEDIYLIGKNAFDEELGIGFRKDSPYIKKFNYFLKEIKDNGVYEQMYVRWTKSLEIADLPKLSPIETDKKLHIGIYSTGLPFVTVKNNQLVGFDIEIMTRFAHHMNAEIEFHDSQFAALIPALISEKIDLICAAMTITEEREKIISFSDSYFLTGARFFTLKDPVILEEKKDTLWDKTKESFYNNIIKEDRYLLILDGLKVTFLLSIFSVLLGTPLGGLICYMRMSKNFLLRNTAKCFIDLIRGIPTLVLLMILFYLVFASSDLSPITVAVIAFGINFAAYAAEMFRTSIESIDSGQYEAGIALGFSKIKTFIYIILPQAVRVVIPVYKGEFINLIKITSIVGYIALQDLTKASDIIRSRTFDAFFPLIMIAVLYFLVAWILTFALDYTERKLTPKSGKQ